MTFSRAGGTRPVPGWAGGPRTPPREDVVFVASGRRGGDDTDATLELRQTDGVLVLLAYASLDALVAGCGRAQPWIAFRRDRLDDVVAVSGASVALWDVVLAPDRRHPDVEERP